MEVGIYFAIWAMMFTIRCGDYKGFRVICRYSYKRHEGKGLKLKFCIISLQFRIMLTIIVPKSQEIARNQIRASSIDYFEGLIKPQKFNDTVKDLTTG